MPYLMFYRVVQCGATEYEGTTLGTTKQTFGYIFMHQIKNDKMIKALFYKGLGVKERKRVRGCDNSTYPKVGVSCFKGNLVANGRLVFPAWMTQSDRKSSLVVKVPPFG
ncbi:MAG: hypothetical protein WAR99_17075 [Saprospiraceae bacterium]